jgi:hypothetical protein
MPAAPSTDCPRPGRNAASHAAAHRLEPHSRSAAPAPTASQAPAKGSNPSRSGRRRSVSRRRGAGRALRGLRPNRDLRQGPASAPARGTLSADLVPPLERPRPPKDAEATQHQKRRVDQISSSSRRHRDWRMPRGWWRRVCTEVGIACALPTRLSHLTRATMRFGSSGAGSNGPNWASLKPARTSCRPSVSPWLSVMRPASAEFSGESDTKPGERLVDVVRCGAPARSSSFSRLRCLGS